MAEEKAYIGYRRAGRRPESQQDRRAAADAPLSALRGFASGVLGGPGDIEALIRMLPGLSEQTVLPTSEDVEKRLPGRELNATPTGRAFTAAGQLGGGFYGGPGSPLRAIAALPSAVTRAAGDFARSGVPVHVIKPKGGNWLPGSVERTVEPLRRHHDPEKALAEIDRVLQIGAPTETVEQLKAMQPRLNADIAMNRWLDQKLSKYIRNEMATPEDPIRALAERGVLHYEPRPTSGPVERAMEARVAGGYPAGGFGESELARNYETMADASIGGSPASLWLSEAEQATLDTMPWLNKVPPETMIYERRSPGMTANLGFEHLTDELRNAINPESGLPANLLWKYADLDKVTVPQAVQRVHDINEWRAAQKAEADMARARNPATHVVKEYPEQGYNWVELKAPEGKESVKSLEDALKYEGETMGHCVGGYCPDVVEGRSKIYSLRDKKGQPHVTIEVRPKEPISTWQEVQEYFGPKRLMELHQEFESVPERTTFALRKFLANKGIKSPDEIVQIKGKANRAPNAEYLPAVQDFVKSGNWSRVGDLQNTGLYRKSDFIDEFKPEQLDAIGRGEYVTMDEIKKLREGKSWKPIDTDPDLDIDVSGFAEGGAVEAGASDPIPYDTAKIQALIDSLHEETYNA